MTAGQDSQSFVSMICKFQSFMSSRVSRVRDVTTAAHAKEIARKLENGTPEAENLIETAARDLARTRPTERCGATPQRWGGTSASCQRSSNISQVMSFLLHPINYEHQEFRCQHHEYREQRR